MDLYVIERNKDYVTIKFEGRNWFSRKLVILVKDLSEDELDIKIIKSIQNNMLNKQ